MKTMSLLKRCLLIFFGPFIFTIVGSFAEAPYFVPNLPIVAQIPLFIVGNLIMLAFYRKWMKGFEDRKPTEVRMKDFLPDVGFGFGIGFVYFVFITLIMLAIGCYRIEDVSFHFMSVLQNFVFMSVVAITEEIVFRGFVYRMIAERYNMVVALIVSALLFGFIHITNPGATTWSSTAIAIEAGIMLGLAYSYHQTLWVPIGIHWAWNFSQGQIFGFAVSGMDTNNPVIQPEITGNVLLTGGSFGAEASIIAVIISFFISYYLYKNIRKSTAE